MNNLLMGFSRNCVNPEEPCSLAGYFNARIWDKIPDDIEARALVMEKNKNRFALLQFDLVTIPETFARKIYNSLPKGLSKQNVIITATHSHTAPEIRETKPGFSEEYTLKAVEKGIKALQEALKKLEPVELFTTKTTDNRFSFNRRYFMKDGTVVTNPPKLSPETDRAEGKTDHSIPIAAFKDMNGKIKAVLANIVNHADTIGGNSVSADWPGFTRRAVEEKNGKDTIFFPLVGCSGNINHVNTKSAETQCSYDEAQKIGKGYAETINKALDKLKKIPSAELKTAFLKVKTDPREISDAQIEEAQKQLEKFKDIPGPEEGVKLDSFDLANKTPAALKYFARELLKMSKNRQEKIFNISAFAIGNFKVISLPAEPFCEIGLKIKNEIFKDSQTMVVSHSNGTGAEAVAGGYIPNQWNYGRGGYETTPRSNPFSIKTAEKLLRAAEKIKKDL